MKPMAIEENNGIVSLKLTYEALDRIGEALRIRDSLQPFISHASDKIFFQRNFELTVKIEREVMTIAYTPTYEPLPVEMFDTEEEQELGSHKPV